MAKKPQLPRGRSRKIIMEKRRDWVRGNRRGRTAVCRKILKGTEMGGQVLGWRGGQGGQTYSAETGPLPTRES